jgi:uncharacterized membrane protein YdjX (TVP38/TMEM64 family)
MTTRQRRLKRVVFTITVVVLAVLAWYVNKYVSLEELVSHEENVRSYIALEPLGSFLVGFGIYFALSLIPGTVGKDIVYGWLFGFWQALTISMLGLTLSGMVIFSLSRYLFQASIERRFVRLVLLMNKRIEKEGAFYLLTLRLMHAPYSIVNPVSGASRVHVWTFFWTTVAGLLPVNAIWVYVGIRLPSLRDLANSGPGAFIDLPLIGALMACAMLPFLFRWMVGHFGIPAAGVIDDATLHESPRDNL